MSLSAVALAEDALTVPDLMDRARGLQGLDAVRFRALLAAVPAQGTADLLRRFETTSDPMILWALHHQCEQRGIPPVLRWPGQQIGPQGDLLDLAADVRWIQRQHPYHRASARGWQAVLKAEPGSSTWHDHLHRQFLYVYPRGMWWKAADGLGLSDAQRQELITMPTAKIRSERLGLSGQRFTDLHQRLLDHAYRHPDRARRHTPELVAQRRARLYRTHILTGCSPARTAKFWALTTGEAMTRQAVAHQVAAVEAILG